jgi:hypothetical protein
VYNPYKGEPYTVGDIIVIFFAVIMGAMNVG